MVILKEVKATAGLLHQRHYFGVFLRGDHDVLTCWNFQVSRK